MTETLTDIVCADFRAERANGSTVQEAIGLVAHRHGRSEDHIRRMLTRKGALNGEGRGRVLGFKLAGAAAVVALGFWAAGPKARPTKSELALGDYKRACTGGDRFATTCKGKFIIWDGTVDRVSDGFVRTRLRYDLAVDVQDVDVKRETLVEGRRVRISGWLADENFVYPDVSDGVINTLETADHAQARSDRAEVLVAARHENQRAFDTITREQKSGRLGAMSKSLTDCQPSALNQQAFGDCLARSRRLQGW